MKTKITFIVAVILLSRTTLMGRVVEITTSTQLINAITTEALDGDTILVPEGTYDIASGTRVITKTITILSNPNASSKPIIRCRLQVGGDVSLFLEGIEFYYDNYNDTPTSNHFIQAQYIYTIPTLSFKDCHIRGYGRSVVRADASGAIPTINNFIIDNCLIEDIGRQANSYQIFSVHYAKISNALIKNTTLYNSKGGIWQGNFNQNFPINFMMENCSVIKVSTTGSKRLIEAKTNPGSVYTLKNCIISNSYDGTTYYLQLSLGSDNDTHLGHIDNVILGNDFNSSKFTATILTTNNEVATTSLAYNYDSLTINTNPNTIYNIGAPKWIVNGITTSTNSNAFEKTYGYLSNNELYIKNLPLNSRINIYSFTGSLITSKINSESIFQFPVYASCIVNIVSDIQNMSMKIIK